MKPGISAFLRALLSATLLAGIVWSLRGQMPAIGSTLAKTNLILFFSAILLFAANIFVLAVRLRLVFTGEGLIIPYHKTLQLSFVGYFFNNFMPTSVGGDLVKGYYAYAQTQEAGKSFVAVFMDRFIGVFSFILLASAALIVSWNAIDVSLKVVIAAFASCGVIALFVALNSKAAGFVLSLLSRLKLLNLGEKLSKIYRMVHEYRNKQGIMIIVMILSIIAQSSYFFVIFLLARSLGAEIPLKTIFLIMPVVSMVSMLPSLGGLGLREGAIVVLFKDFVGVDNAFAISILLLATLLSMSLVGALIYAFASQFKFKRVKLEGSL